MTKKKAMEAGRTHIMFVLDRSGSMAGLRNAVIDGFNKLIADQREDQSPCSVSLVQFDNAYEENYLDMPLADVPALTALTYEPRGGTALLDALGRAIVSLGTRVDKLAAKDRPEKVIVIVHTDGEENASKEYKIEQVRTLVKEQQQEAGWLFVFAGANIDSFQTGQSYGMKGMSTANYAGHAGGVKALYGSTSAAVLRSRGMKSESYESVVRGESSFFSQNEVHAMATGDASSSLVGFSGASVSVGIAPPLGSVPKGVPLKRSTLPRGSSKKK